MFKGILTVFALFLTISVANATNNEPKIDATIEEVSDNSYTLVIHNRTNGPIDCLLTFNSGPFTEVTVEANSDSKEYSFTSPTAAPSYGWVCNTE